MFIRNRSKLRWTSVMGVGLSLCLGGLAFAANDGAATETIAPQYLSSVVNNPTGATVTFVGTPVFPPATPANGIVLQPGQPIPSNAPLGQPYILPTVLPKGWQNKLVVKVNPGQGVKIQGYSGTVIAESTVPSVVTLKPNPDYTASSTASTTAAAQGSSVTWVVNSLRTDGSDASGGTIDFNGTFVMDNHVLNHIVDDNGTVVLYPSQRVIITRSSSTYEVDQTDPYDEYNMSQGLASIGNPAPTGPGYQIDIVLYPTVPQQDTAYSYNNSSFALQSKDLTLQGTQATPPYNPFPDPWSNIYNQFTPALTAGWSGAGIWDSKTHLVAMVANGSSSLNSEYGFNGGDIEAYCSQNGIPFSTSTGS